MALQVPPPSGHPGFSAKFEKYKPNATKLVKLLLRSGAPDGIKAEARTLWPDLVAEAESPNKAALRASFITRTCDLVGDKWHLKWGPKHPGFAAKGGKHNLPEAAKVLKLLLKGDAPEEIKGEARTLWPSAPMVHVRPFNGSEVQSSHPINKLGAPSADGPDMRHDAQEQPRSSQQPTVCAPCV